MAQWTLSVLTNQALTRQWLVLKELKQRKFLYSGNKCEDLVVETNHMFFWAWPAPNYQRLQDRTGHGKIFARWFGMLKGKSFVNMKAEMDVFTNKALDNNVAKEARSLRFQVSILADSSWKVTN